MHNVITISIELWRLISIIASFAVMCFVLGALTSKWKYKAKQKTYHAGDLIVMLDRTDGEPNTYLKLTVPLSEVVHKPIAIFTIKWDTRGHMIYENELERK